MIHPNSTAANKTVDHGARARLVLETLRRLDHPATDREICRAVGAGDMNYVRPSITRLVEAGVLREVDSVECPVSHRTVRRVWIVEKQAGLWEGEAA